MRPRRSIQGRRAALQRLSAPATRLRAVWVCSPLRALPNGTMHHDSMPTPSFETAARRGEADARRLVGRAREGAK